MRDALRHAVFRRAGVQRHHVGGGDFLKNLYIYLDLIWIISKTIDRFSKFYCIIYIGQQYTYTMIHNQVLVRKKTCLICNSCFEI